MSEGMKLGGNGDENGAKALKGGRRKTAWMAHVKATMRSHPGLKLKQVLKMAKKTYKKTRSMRGGESDIVPGIYGGMEGGRRRRRGGRTRRSRARRGGDEE